MESRHLSPRFNCIIGTGKGLKAAQPGTSYEAKPANLKNSDSVYQMVLPQHPSHRPCTCTSNHFKATNMSDKAKSMGYVCEMMMARLGSANIQVGKKKKRNKN